MTQIKTFLLKYKWKLAGILLGSLAGLPTGILLAVLQEPVPFSHTGKAALCTAL